MILVRFGQQHMDAFGPHYLPVLNIDYLAFQCHKECFNYLYQLYVVIINFFIDTLVLNTGEILLNQAKLN